MAFPTLTGLARACLRPAALVLGSLTLLRGYRLRS